MTDLTRTSPAENLELLAARLADHLSPAEKDELREAAALLRFPAVPQTIYRCNKHGGYGFVSDCGVCKNEVSPAVPEGWVSVKDRLPDDPAPVLVIEKAPGWGQESTSGIFSLAIYKDGKFQIDRGPSYVCEPTHWMPLPSPPREKGSP